MSMLKQKGKLIFILFLFSCIFLSMSFASAESNITDNTVNIDGDDSSDFKSFKDLDSEINGDLSKKEIILNEDYTYQDCDNFTEGIFINRSLTIDGQGHTIDAKSKSRVFLINSSKVTLKNIIFINGYEWSVGGALYFDNNSIGYIINSTFINNFALYGGAIGQYENSTLTIVNSSFIKNRGNNGAAIYCHNSSNTIQNSFFINNIASGISYGGAISYIWYSNSSIMNSVFINNSAEYGGGIFFSKYCKGVIVNSTFISNKAYDGGVIAFSDGGSNIVNSTFNNNLASRNGGAIYFTKGSKNYINNSIFINNSAKRSGGGIFYFDKTKGIVSNSVFIENNAENGGGIYYLNESTKSIVINSIFIRNYAENSCAMNGHNARNCTIIRFNPILTADSITSFYNDSKYLTITLKDHKNSPINNTSISISINNVVEILKTDSKGQINIPTKNLIPNSYNVLIIFNGTDKYENASINSHIIINKANLKLIAKKKTFKAKTKSKKYVVSIKDNFNNAIKEINVKLKVKGKTYKAKTNNNGKATFKINKLIKKGKYKGVVKFDGNEKYNKFSKKVKIVIK